MYLTKLITILAGVVTLIDSATAFTNPIRNPGGSDPQIVYTGGYYYLLSTTVSKSHSTPFYDS